GEHIHADCARGVRIGLSIRDVGDLNAVVRSHDLIALEREIDCMPIGADAREIYLRHWLVSDVSIFETIPILEFEDAHYRRSINGTFREYPGCVMRARHWIHATADAPPIAILRREANARLHGVIGPTVRDIREA